MYLGLGKATVATLVHHRKPLASGGTNDESNLMSLCVSSTRGFTKEKRRLIISGQNKSECVPVREAVRIREIPDNRQSNNGHDTFLGAVLRKEAFSGHHPAFDKSYLRFRMRFRSLRNCAVVTKSSMGILCIHVS